MKSVRKKNLLKYFISAVTVSQFIFPLSYAHASVEAAQLDLVALDTSVQCNRIFFRSSSHFQKTIFVMPRVAQGAGPEGRRSIEIIPTTKGKYIMYLRLYFPNNDDALKDNGASTGKIDQDSCNFDAVKDAINRSSDSKYQSVSTIARMPLTSIDVSIPGISQTARVGRSMQGNEEVDILDYNGKSLTFIFTLDEKERAQFESEVVTKDGVAAQVKFRFQARNRNGSVQAEINSLALQANFAANAKGKTFMTQAEVTATLRASMDSKVLNIVAEDSKDGSSSRIVEQIISKILNDIDLSPEPEADKPEARASMSATDRISVKAVLDVIVNKMSRSVSFEQIAVPETATAQTELRLKTLRLRAPEYQEIAVQADYTEPSSGFEIKAGEVVSLIPNYSFMEKIEYKPVKSYVTTGLINQLNLVSAFPDLASASMAIQDKNINGTLMAVGTWTPLEGYFPVSDPSSYRWVRTELIPIRSRESSYRYATNLETLKTIPVSLTFAALGEEYKYQLADLIGEHDEWTGTYDNKTGRVILKAKQDLGLVTFRENMSGVDNIETMKTPLILDQVTMETHSLFGSTSESEPYVLRKDNSAIIRQRTIVINMSRPKSDASQNSSTQQMQQGSVFQMRSN